MFIGIDNGLNGGITVINDEQEIVDSIVMPIIKIKGKNHYDINKIVQWFNEFHEPDKLIVCLEKTHVRPVQGKRACFMSGFGYGLMQGIIESLGISYMIISPQEWMKEFELSSKDTKESILFCQRKWPTYNWTATDRSKKLHDGKTDSACLALYALRRSLK